jgi:hypothetical protein
MLGSTLTVTLDGSGGAAKVLPLINQDAYSSEYFLDETTVQWRAKVRHSHDNVKAGESPRDRHVVTFEQFSKPTTTYPNGYYFTVVYKIQNDPRLGNRDPIDLSEAKYFYMVKAGGVAAKLLGWES